MKLLLTSGGITNPSVCNALVDLLGKPIAESSALCIPTAQWGHPVCGPASVRGFVVGEPPWHMMSGLGWKSVGLLELTALPTIGEERWLLGHGRNMPLAGSKLRSTLVDTSLANRCASTPTAFLRSGLVSGQITVFVDVVVACWAAQSGSRSLTNAIGGTWRLDIFQEQLSLRKSSWIPFEKGVTQVAKSEISYTADPRVDAYIDSLPDWQQTICHEVRELVHAADKDVTETIKRTRLPYFTLDGNICALMGTKNHLNIFIYDPIAPDPAGLINQGQNNSTARGIQVREGEILNKDALLNLFKAVIANNRAGGWRRVADSAG